MQGWDDLQLFDSGIAEHLRQNADGKKYEDAAASIGSPNQHKSALHQDALSPQTQHR